MRRAAWPNLKSLFPACLPSKLERLLREANSSCDGHPVCQGMAEVNDQFVASLNEEEPEPDLERLMRRGDSETDAE